MSSEIAIKVSKLSKNYQIYTEPQDRLKQSFFPRLQKIAGMRPLKYYQDFGALKDVSFEVKRGDTVGIIGRNGSGKSTLLQLICGTLAATSGSIKTKGRIGALLELGAGFNPEFTGRENVYMSGSIYGLSQAEIDDRFDDIASFADIGDFIEQPVKIYSSGMFVRLAFAVIVHIDADILIIDEALAVGDAVFTQKCMHFIRAFQKRGTLLFVSHDIGSVQNLCQTGIWLDHGAVQMIGPSKDVAEAYLQYTLQETYGAEAKLSATQNDIKNKASDSEITLKEELPVSKTGYSAEVRAEDNLANARGWKTGAADLISIKLTRLDGVEADIFLGGEKIRVTVRAKANQLLPNPIIGFTVRDRLGQELFGENTLPVTDLAPLSIQAEQEFFGEFEFTLPMLPNGQYALMASVANGTLYDHIQHHFLHDALILTVTSSKIRWGLVGIPFDKVALEIAHEH